MKNSPLRVQSQYRIGGMPLVSIALGADPARGETEGTARGILAIGDSAHGVLALGRQVTGVFALGGVAVGVIALGGAAAAGAIAVGGASAGYLAVGSVAVGRHTYSGRSISPRPRRHWK
ncbi:MAG TPA: hypothetical protein VF756_32275 [Thermoanaerobaculia bacterium]